MKHWVLLLTRPGVFGGGDGENAAAPRGQKPNPEALRLMI